MEKKLFVDKWPRTNGSVVQRFFVLMVIVAIGNGAGWAQSQFEKAVAERGYDVDVVDLSDDDDIVIEEPSLALVNLTGFATWPQSKHVTRQGRIEVYDGNGHYFNKPVTIAGQGGYTTRFPKKNFVCHFTDNRWNEDGAPDIKIGQWVKQDAFHFKAFYTEFLRGIGEVGYKLFDQMVADRRPYWERGGYFHDSEARCFPDGFPCAVYLNGKFHGVFAWQLKKHRKNMNQKKALAEHIHLDGNLNDNYLFKGHISWNQFEVRTPKELYDIVGRPYDGNSPTELIDKQCSMYYASDDNDTVRAAKQLSEQVKQHIVAMSLYWGELQQLESRGATAAQMRSEMEERYDVEALTDYAVHFYFTYNGDGSLKNWQWFTYDGKRWAVTPYDLDQTFGVGLYGNLLPPNRPLEKLTSGPFYWMDRYYAHDIADRYGELRRKGVFDYDNVVALFDDWHDRVGEALYASEEDRWGGSPCYSDAVCNNGWEAVSTDDPVYQVVGLPTYNAYTTYHKDDVCWLEGRLWRATATVTGVKPFIINANRDSMERLYQWIQGRIDFLDACFAYDNTRVDEQMVNDMDNSNRRLEGIYTLSGIKVNTPVSGQTYIFRYSDGTARKQVAR